MTDRLMTADQVAELLCVPVGWVYEQARRGEIPCVTLGRYRRFRAEAIQNWIEQQEQNGPGGGDAPRGLHQPTPNRR